MEPAQEMPIHSNPANLSPDVGAKDAVIVIKNKSQKSRSNIGKSVIG